ncbi:hypothetical protein YGS_C2P0265 [Sphingobium sp. YG1]|nr:hypothetical protein YGS_C2P0265 [Sphingobium sp. YG1]
MTAHRDGLRQSAPAFKQGIAREQRQQSAIARVQPQAIRQPDDAGIQFGRRGRCARWLCQGPQERRIFGRVVGGRPLVRIDAHQRAVLHKETEQIRPGAA